MATPRRRLLPGYESLDGPFKRRLTLRRDPQSRADQRLKDWGSRQFLGGEHLDQAGWLTGSGSAVWPARSGRTRPCASCEGDRKRNCGSTMPHGFGLPTSWTRVVPPCPMAHSRHTRVVQLAGQPPPRAMKSATVSVRRLASACTRAMEAVR